MTSISGNQHAPSQSIASGIFQIKTTVATFQRLVNTLGTYKDTPQLREKLHKTRLQIGQLVKDTSAKLKHASETDHRVEVIASEKIADAKLAKDFEAVLKEFQKAQKLAAQRETAYTPFVQQSSYTTGSSAADISADKGQKHQALVAESTSRGEVSSSLDRDICFNEALIEGREKEIEDIHQQIVEINGIFKDLSVLLHDRFTIDDIGYNIENSRAATVRAKSQLDEAAKAQKSKLLLICWLLVILVIIGLLIIVIVLLVA